MTKYPWDGESRACYCKRESRARGNQEQDRLYFREKSEFSSQLNIQSPQEFLRGWKSVSVQFSVCRQCSCREQLCLPSAVGSLGMALQIMLVNGGITFAELRGDSEHVSSRKNSARSHSRSSLY